jgi:hypothetical protein
MITDTFGPYLQKNVRDHGGVRVLPTGTDVATASYQAGSGARRWVITGTELGVSPDFDYVTVGYRT